MTAYIKIGTKPQMIRTGRNMKAALQSVKMTQDILAHADGNPEEVRLENVKRKEELNSILRQWWKFWSRPVTVRTSYHTEADGAIPVIISTKL